MLISCMLASLVLSQAQTYLGDEVWLPEWNEPIGKEPFEWTHSPRTIPDGGGVTIYYPEGKLHEFDYIALTCGPVYEENEYFMMEYVSLEDRRTHFDNLPMMRCNYVATYYRYNTNSQDHEKWKERTIPMRDAFKKPKHGHIALTTEEDAMAIMFNSASNKTPQVRFGLTKQKLNHFATGTSTTYQASDMCHGPANIPGQLHFRDPGFMHTVILHNLVPATTYYYRYGNSEDGWSTIESFHTRPRTLEANFIAYADMGVNDSPAAIDTSVRVYEEVLNGYDSFLLHFGDISYARGQASIWDTFFQLIEPYATKIPYMISIGNHEYDYTSGGEKDPSNCSGPTGAGFHPSWGNFGSDSSGECSVPMYHRWHVPSNGHSIYWYSFNYGGIHVIQMSSEHDWTRGSMQYQWLQSDLQNVNRTETPWVVLTSHRMMYTTQMGEEADLKVADHMKEELDALLYENHVNLMLTGHQHSYERSCAVFKKKCVGSGKAPVHVVVGSAGASLERKGFSQRIGNWSVAHANEFGYLRVKSTAESMTCQFIMNRNGEVYDEFILKPWM